MGRDFKGEPILGVLGYSFELNTMHSRRRPEKRATEALPVREHASGLRAKVRITGYATRCDAMLCDATRCEAMRRDAKRCCTTFEKQTLGIRL